MTPATPSSVGCPPTKQRIYPRPPVVPAEAGTQRKTKHVANHPLPLAPVIPSAPRHSRGARPVPRYGGGNPEPGDKRAGHPTNHSRRSPLPRWERARACPGLEPGVRVNHSRPSRTRRPKGAGHHSLYANPTTSVSATEALKPVIPSHPHRHSRACGNPEPGDKWERGIIAHLRKSA